MVVLSQEREIDRFEVSFYAPHKDSGELSAEPQLFDLDEFDAAMSEAKVRLKLLDQPIRRSSGA